MCVIFLQSFFQTVGTLFSSPPYQKICPRHIKNVHLEEVISVVYFLSASLVSYTGFFNDKKYMQTFILKSSNSFQSNYAIAYHKLKAISLVLCENISYMTAIILKRNLSQSQLRLSKSTFNFTFCKRIMSLYYTFKQTTLII